jgi:hypothetical protein
MMLYALPRPSATCIDHANTRSFMESEHLGIVGRLHAPSYSTHEMIYRYRAEAMAASAWSTDLRAAPVRWQLRTAYFGPATSLV